MIGAPAQPRRRPAQGHRPRDVRVRGVGRSGSRSTASSSARRSAAAASRSIDTTRAERAPGVRRVLTHRDAPRAARSPSMAARRSYSRASPVLASRRGPLLRRAGRARRRRRRSSRRAPRRRSSTSRTSGSRGASTSPRARVDAYAPKTSTPASRPTPRSATSTARSPRRRSRSIELYTTPYQFSQPMEPHSCLAVWDGDVVTVHASDADRRRRRGSGSPRRSASSRRRSGSSSRYVGGGFGSKLGVHAETILAVIAARELGSRSRSRRRASRCSSSSATARRPASACGSAPSATAR